MKNYAVYPMAKMKITQNYSGSTSHMPHTTGSPKDYPIDEAGADSGRDYMLCPCDEMTVSRVYGVGSSGTNTIWLQSKDKAYLADGSYDYFVMMAIHPNDDDLKKIKVGQVFKRGDKICREGTDGNATGNHLHISVGKGKIKGNGWAKNSKGKWVLTTTGGACRPEDIFFIDGKKTTVLKNGGLKFKNVPTETKETKKNTNYIVNTSLLYVRSGPGTSYSKKTYKELTASAQKQIVALCGKKRDGYVKDLEFTAQEIKGEWAETPSGWVNLKYCKAVK